jgi:hypothetical protein
MKWFPYFGVHGDPSVVTDMQRPAFTTVATVHTSPDDYGKANCHLMASAPDLLKACRDVLAALQKSTQETGEILWLDHVLPGVHDSAMGRLQDVIAQAEGQPVSEIG